MNDKNQYGEGGIFDFELTKALRPIVEMTDNRRLGVCDAGKLLSIMDYMCGVIDSCEMPYDFHVDWNIIMDELREFNTRLNEIM